MPSSTCTLVHSNAVSVAQNLITELNYANVIINVMLNAMTTAKKSLAARKLCALGVSSEGMTRHHERQAVLDKAQAQVVAVDLSVREPQGFAIRQPYSRTVINQGEALDYAQMRGQNLNDLLSAIAANRPTSSISSARKLASEVVALLDLVDEEALAGGKSMLKRAHVRYAELADLLESISMEGKDPLMWLAQQIALEFSEALNQVAAEARTGETA